MEVAVAEEKKKIFRARKTMKISDRQQLETLHSTLLSSGATLTNPSPPPVLNGRHKEDGHKALDKESNDVSEPQAMSPASRGSPEPLLSLNLSPSPPICQSPKNKDENTPFPTSPFSSTNIEAGKSGEGVMQGSPSNGSPDTTTETKAGIDTKSAKIEVMTVNNKDKHTTAELPASDSLKGSGKNVAMQSLTPTLPSVKKVDKDRSESDCTQDMEVGCETTKAKNGKTKTEKPYSPKASQSSFTCTIPLKHQEMEDLEQNEEKVLQAKTNKDIKEAIKESKEGKKGALKLDKMDADHVRIEAKKEKKDAVVKTSKSFRPSSTPPSETDVKEKSSTSGLKRVLSEGEEKDKVERDGKRPKVEGVELEAQLEVNITAKASSRLKLEKVVQQLVEDRLRVLQLTVFDQNFQELKERVEKIDCSSKHQSTLNTLQAKISRLTKKFGEANQALENKRKKEALATAPAATAFSATTAAVAAKAPGPSGSPAIPRLLRRHSEESQPQTPRKGLAPPGGKTSTVTVKNRKKRMMMMMMRERKTMMRKEKNVMMIQEEQEEQKVLMQKAAPQGKDGGDGAGGVAPQFAGLADRLANFSEGKCRVDIKLRPISSQCEKWVFKLCKGSWAQPRADRYASYIFRNLVHYETYCDWVLQVNYMGVLGKDALPKNLRKILRTYIEKRFPELTCDNWREIRDSINELLRVERRPEFFSHH